jgi:hypothetical protein
MDINNEEGYWKEDTFSCKYCGTKLKENNVYCSEDCKKQDSVWNWNDD